jgi:ClpX C4-type zinc finger
VGLPVICIEVIVNGHRRTIAGASSAEIIETSVWTYPGLQQSWLRVSGDIVSEDQPTADAEWVTMQLSVGDKVEVQIIETDSPVAPNLSRTDPSVPASDEIPFVCAFCRKDSQQTEGMVASHKAMICRDCISYLYKMMSQDDSQTSA